MHAEGFYSHHLDEPSGLGDGFNCHLHLTDEEADSERQSLILRSLVSGLTLSS